MRKLLLFVCFSIVLLFMSACGNEEKSKEDSSAEQESTDISDSAREFGEKFIKALYTIEDTDFDLENPENMQAYQDEFASYFTEDEFEALNNKRFFIMPQEVAAKQKNTIDVKDITLEASDDSKEDDSIEFEHAFTLIFKDEDGKEVDNAELAGQMVIENMDDDLIISRYYDEGIPNELLQP